MNAKLKLLQKIIYKFIQGWYMRAFSSSVQNAKKKTKRERALKPHIDTKHSRDIQESMPYKKRA